jgi:hypothetical protein
LAEGDSSYPKALDSSTVSGSKIGLPSGSTSSFEPICQTNRRLFKIKEAFRLLIEAKTEGVDALRIQIHVEPLPAIHDVVAAKGISIEFISDDEDDLQQGREENEVYTDGKNDWYLSEWNGTIPAETIARTLRRLQARS